MDTTLDFIQRESDKIKRAAERQRRECGQLTLGQFIERLRPYKDEKYISYDFVHFKPTGLHSYRGFYEDLAIGYSTDSETTPASLLAECEKAIGKIFTGYKGGDFEMNYNTVLWVAESDESGSTAIIDVVMGEYDVLILTRKFD